MSGHHVKWTHDHDYVAVEFTCDDETCSWRERCDGDCEDWFWCADPDCDHGTDLDHCENGHEVTTGHKCAPVEWIEAEGYAYALETFAGERGQSVRDGAVEFTWEGFHYTWRYT